MAEGSVGMVQRITGPVVDILFDQFDIPDIFNAINVEVKNEKYTLVHYKTSDLKTITGYIETDYIEMDKLDTNKIVLISIIIASVLILGIIFTTYIIIKKKK